MQMQQPTGHGSRGDICGAAEVSTAFDNDAAPIIIMLLFALTNGYVSSLIMMYGPSQVTSQHSM